MGDFQGYISKKKIGRDHQVNAIYNDDREIEQERLIRDSYKVKNWFVRNVVFPSKGLYLSE